MLPKAQPFEVLSFFLHFLFLGSQASEVTVAGEASAVVALLSEWSPVRICFGRSSWSTLLLITKTSELNLKYAIMRERATAHLWDLSSLVVFFPFLKDAVEVSDRLRKIGQLLQWLREGIISQAQLMSLGNTSIIGSPFRDVHFL